MAEGKADAAGERSITQEMHADRVTASNHRAVMVGLVRALHAYAAGSKNVAGPGSAASCYQNLKQPYDGLDGLRRCNHAQISRARLITASANAK